MKQHQEVTVNLNFVIFLSSSLVEFGYFSLVEKGELFKLLKTCTIKTLMLASKNASTLILAHQNTVSMITLLICKQRKQRQKLMTTSTLS